MTENKTAQTEAGIYSLHRPEGGAPLPLLFDSPHSGRTYPDDFQTNIHFQDLICGEDRYVDDLFAAAPAYGATLLYAEFPRCYIDPNRHEGDIPPHLVGDDWDHDAFPLTPSDKSQSGIGLIRETFHTGHKFYYQPLSAQTIMQRIKTYYRPYHDALAAQINRLHQEHGSVLHINCHSMPFDSAPFTPHNSFMGKNAYKQGRVDIVIGDRDGATCDAQWRETAGQIFKDLGFSVLYNKGFKGAEIVRRYGAPQHGRNSMQIEINRGLYLDKDGRHKSDHYPALKNAIDQFIKQISAEVSSRI